MLQLGADHTPGGFLVVDAKQQTDVFHVYAIGDVVSDTGSRLSRQITKSPRAAASRRYATR
ncbi:MAG: hypothetical protein ABW175_16515 [Bradyrhizobium sp.]